MKIYVEDNYEKMSKRAAGIMAAQILLKPDSVLGLATGSSPVGTYEELVKDYENGVLDFSNITSVNLDEYKGLTPDNNQSYRYFMNDHLFNHVNINKERTFFPDGLAEDVDAECARYQTLLDRFGGADMQLLGIGHNGHIGFNEPGESLNGDVHCVKLSERTREANKRFFNSIDEVPEYAFSMGLKSIMSAKKILIIASGEDKAPMIKEAFFGKITTKVPASILQLHPDVTVVVDKAAYSMVEA